MTMSSPSSSRPIATTVHITDDAAILRLKAILSSAFKRNPVTLALIHDADGTRLSPVPITVDDARINKHFDLMFDRFEETGAIFLQAGDWSAVSIWEPPGFDEPALNKASGLDESLKKEWNEQVRIVRARNLAQPGQTVPQGSSVRPEQEINRNCVDSGSTTVPRLRPYYHLALVGRDPNIAAVPGATSAVIVPVLQRAKQEGVPAWLEATAPAAVSVYEHFDFRVTDRITIGKGKYDPTGGPKHGGEGVTFWAMIYDGHLKSL